MRLSHGCCGDLRWFVLELVYTAHARRRQAERDITDAEVEAVLDSPSIPYTDRAGNPIYIAHPGGRRIKVVVKKDSSPRVVITVAD
jgi:hypothetical protein